jgi:hypothetical protein
VAAELLLGKSPCAINHLFPGGVLDSNRSDHTT